MTNTNINFSKACTEVNCLLNYFPKEMIDKIPKGFKKLIDSNIDDIYTIELEQSKKIIEQKISKDAKILLCVIKYNYWSTALEKEIISKKILENEKKIREEINKMYDIDNIFNSNTNKVKDVEESLAIIPHQEKNFITIIFEKMKEWLLKNKIKNKRP